MVTMAKRRTFDMPNEQICSLIHEIKTRGRSIWNTEDENYNNRFDVIASWKEISRVMNLPEEVVRLKWRNLRDLFKRETKRFNCQTIEDYQGKWRYFQRMWFLHRPENLTKDNESHNRDANGNSEDNMDEEFDETSENFIKFEPSDRREVEVYLDDPIDPLPDKRRRYNDDDDDYDVMFLKSLTPYFRQLEPLRKLALRSKLQDIIMNEIVSQNAANNLNSN